MNTSIIVPSAGGHAGSAAKPGFASLLTGADRSSGPAPVERASVSVAPATGNIISSTLRRDAEAAMPADDDFIVVDKVAVEETTTGEEVLVVSGEAMDEQAALATAAAKGGAVVLPLSEPRLGSRSIAGAMFASMLIDQRNGVLPNPFSLMRIPERAPVTGSEDATGAASARSDVLPDAPSEDALATGKELSRLEAALSVLVEKLETMLKTLGILAGNSGRGDR